MTFLGQNQSSKAQPQTGRRFTVPPPLGQEINMDSPSDKPLRIVIMSPLVTLLPIREREKGAPLTESEVLGIRDRAGSIALPTSVALALQEKRGYPDILPENCWNQWQQARQKSVG
jgi:hypothetical protein